MINHRALITCKCGRGFISPVELVKLRIVKANPCPECGIIFQNTWDIDLLDDNGVLLNNEEAKEREFVYAPNYTINRVCHKVHITEE